MTTMISIRPGHVVFAGGLFDSDNSLIRRVSTMGEASTVLTAGQSLRVTASDTDDIGWTFNAGNYKVSGRDRRRNVPTFNADDTFAALE